MTIRFRSRHNRSVSGDVDSLKEFAQRSLGAIEWLAQTEFDEAMHPLGVEPVRETESRSFIDLDTTAGEAFPDLRDGPETSPSPAK
jgi:hypothetical protein